MFKCLYSFNDSLPEYLNSLTVSPDGILLVGCFHNMVKVWDLTIGKINHQFSLDGNPDIGHFHTLVNPDWKTIISSNNVGRLSTYDLWTGEEIFYWFFDYAEKPQCLAFNSDGKFLLEGVDSKKNKRYEIKIIESCTGKLINILSSIDRINFLQMSPCDRFLIAQYYNSLTQVWDWQKNKIINIFSAYSALPKYSNYNFIYQVCRHRIKKIATLINGQTIAVVSQVNGQYGTTVEIWNLETGEVIDRFNIKQRKTQQVEFEPHLYTTITPDGSLLVIANISEIEVWDLPKRKQLCILKGHQSIIDYLTINEDCTTIASYSYGDGIKVWQRS